MQPKMVAGNLISEDKLKEFIERDCKLLTSKNNYSSYSINIFIRINLLIHIIHYKL